MHSHPCFLGLSAVAFSLLFSGVSGWWYPSVRWFLAIHAGLMVASAVLALLALPRSAAALVVALVVMALAKPAVQYAEDVADRWCPPKTEWSPDGWATIDYVSGTVTCHANGTTVPIVVMLDRANE